MVVTVTFAEKDGKTVQTFHQTPFSSVESRDSHIGGWNSLFNSSNSTSRTSPWPNRRDCAHDHAHDL